MRRFADLHLKIPRAGLKELEGMLRLASDLGYSTVAVSFAPSKREDVKQARTMCSDLGLDLVTRVDLEPKNVDGLLKSLRQLRQRFEIIAVRCLTKSVARQAGKDRRVDLLNFPTDAAERERLYFDRQEAVLASGALSALELNASTLLRAASSNRARLLSTMRREVEEARRRGVPLILSSGAESPYGMRAPRDLASLLTLLDVDLESALDAVSEEPLRIVERNREKLEEGFISPGVRLIKVDRKWSLAG
ncbi:MAG: RNase P subunit p30 family protein [Candidatus Bathyarchaeia archaeon]